MKHTKSGILKFKLCPGFKLAEAGDDTDYYQACGFLNEDDVKTYWLTDCQLKMIVLPGVGDNLVDATKQENPVLKYKITVTIEPME